MTEPIAFWNGQLISASQASVPVWDAGFVLGTTVAEQLRTFAGRLFQLEAHLDRLAHSLEIVGIDPGLSRAELARTATEVAAHNHRLLSAGDDLNLTMFCTPGPYPAMIRPNAATGPTVCIHTFPLPFRLWADKYRQGESLVTTPVEQVSPRSWPRELKCRSRMHYYLADRQARQIEPAARALMIDDAGFVTEATTANVLAYFPDRGLVGPPRAKVLPGISLAVLLDLARAEGIGYSEQDLRPEDLSRAAELMFASTSVCVLPVVRLNGRAVGSGQPGPVQQRLLAGWSKLVGIDIPEQARRFAGR